MVIIVVLLLRPEGLLGVEFKERVEDFSIGEPQANRHNTNGYLAADCLKISFTSLMWLDLWGNR